MGQKEIRKAIMAHLSKNRYIWLLTALGMFILLLPEWPAAQREQSGPDNEDVGSAYSLEHTQQNLQEILTQMDGVGRVEVMLTVSSDSKRLYQNDQEVTYEGDGRAPGRYDSKRETVILDRGSLGETPLQTQEIYPEYIGALVVCDGADHAGTVLKIKEAVSVLTGLGTDRISVAGYQKS